MTIQKLLNDPVVLYQKADDECGLPEPALTLCHDATPILVLGQEGREITINLASATPLCKALARAAVSARLWEAERKRKAAEAKAAA